MRILRLLATGVAFGAPNFRERDGIWSTYVHPTELPDYSVDWLGWLAGDTISTSSWVAENANVDSTSNTTNSTTAWDTAPIGPCGSIISTIGTLGGRTRKLRLRLYKGTS